MKKTFKSIIVFISLLLLCFSLAACEEEDVKEKEKIVGDFSITIAVDKTVAHVGDTLTITVTLKNISGEDITIWLSPWDTLNTPIREDIIRVAAFPEYENLVIVVSDLGGSMRSEVIEKDAVLERTMEFSIEELTNYKAIAAVVFYMGDEQIWIDSEPIKIIVREIEK